MIPRWRRTANSWLSEGHGLTRRDILVIGAGMAGCGAAARLAPHAKVVVLEMEDRPAYHTTGRSAATFILNYGNDVLRAMNADSEDVLRTGGDLSETGFLSPRGVLMVEEPGMATAFEDYVAGASGLGHSRPERSVEMLPDLSPGHGGAGRARA